MSDSSRLVDPAGYRLEMTCRMVPEQYDVVKNDKIVGYLRLRSGHFTAEACDGDYVESPWAELVYEHEWPDDVYKGCFDSAGEAEVHLAAAVRALDAFYARRGV